MSTDSEKLKKAKDEFFFYHQLKHRLIEIVEKNNLPENKLHIEACEGYSSVNIGAYLILRLHLRGKSSYIEFGKKFAHYLTPQNMSICTELPEWYRAAVTLENQPEIEALVCALADASAYLIPTEFGCCSQYEECSDARKCVNRNRELAMLCNYRKVLKSGRVFYGGNRNVD